MQHQTVTTTALNECSQLGLFLIDPLKDSTRWWLHPHILAPLVRMLSSIRPALLPVYLAACAAAAPPLPRTVPLYALPGIRCPQKLKLPLAEEALAGRDKWLLNGRAQQSAPPLRQALYRQFQMRLSSTAAGSSKLYQTAAAHFLHRISCMHLLLKRIRCRVYWIW